jgi:hypothetical protein
MSTKLVPVRTAEIIRLPTRKRPANGFTDDELTAWLDEVYADAEPAPVISLTERIIANRRAAAHAKGWSPAAIEAVRLEDERRGRR